MPDHEERRSGKPDVGGELGISRRDMLRRSAVVGGTLLWVAPAIQSLAPAASAQENRVTPETCAACYCWNGDMQNPSVGPGGGRDFCTHNGPTGFQASAEACDDWCTHAGGSGAPGGPYEHSQYCQGVGECLCNDRTDAGPNGVNCD